MRIAFVIPQGATGSTLLGRVLPLASRLSPRHNIHILGLSEPVSLVLPPQVNWHVVGSLPFRYTTAGKERYRGVYLLRNMIRTFLRTWKTLRRIRPDIIVIVKALPATALGVRLYRFLPQYQKAMAVRPRRASRGRVRIILDVDDFELVANKLSSSIQRVVLHWTEYVCARMADEIIAATPFLYDHYVALRHRVGHTHVIPTGFSPEAALSPRTAYSTTPTILYLGSVSVASGHRVDLLPEILLQLSKKFTAPRLVIAGDGDDVQALKEEFAKHNLTNQVVWRGRFQASQVADILKDVDIVVDPIDSSTTVRAKSSYRAAVATAFSKPIVTSNIGIMPQLVPPSLHERFFAAPLSAREYAQKIVDLLSRPLTPAEQTTLHAHAKTFTWEKLAQHYERVLINTP